MKGLILADEVLTVGVPADKLIKLHEPSPVNSKLRGLKLAGQVTKNAVLNESKEVYYGPIEHLNVGLAVRNTLTTRLDFRVRYGELPR